MIKPFDFKKYAQLQFYFWLYTLAVILWGAWVRISHSGDGCGDHWPLCSGRLIPDFQMQKTWIEYTHRLMTGAYGLFVIYFFYKINKSPASLWTKKLNVALLLLMISEALLGAILVKGKLVTTDDSILRLIVMIFHQLNSFLLTGSTFLLFLALRTEPLAQVSPVPLVMAFKSRTPLVLFLLLAISGAVAALSVTLFPSVSVWNGILQDFSTDAHLFVRLRILHPVLASLIGIGFMSWLFAKNYNRAAFEFLGAMALGVMTILTLSPLPLKLAHLLIAHLLWARLLYLFVSSPDSNNR